MVVETLTSVFGKSWVEALASRFSDIRDSRRRELSRIGDVFVDPAALASVYVEPDCQTLNPANDDEDSVSAVVRSPIMQQIARFIDQDAPALNDGRRQLLLLADAGMGKTSLLVMIKLTHLTSFWPKDYRCVLLKLTGNVIEEIQGIEGKSNTVLLLDALDEDPNAWSDVRSRLIEILTATQHFRRVIITCRTQFFPDDEGDPFFRHAQGKIRVGAFTCPMNFLSLFSDQQVREYLEKKYSEISREDARQRIEGAEEILQRMGSLRFRPLLLAYIDDFYDSGEIRWTELAVYRALTSAWLNREQRKFTEMGRPASAEKLAIGCMHLARIMHANGDRHMSEADLKLRSEGISALKEINYMDVGGRSLLNRDSDGAFRFSHFSIQEFLIAQGLVEGIFEQASDSTRCTEKVIKFLLQDRRERMSELQAEVTKNANRTDGNVEEIEEASKQLAAKVLEVEQSSERGILSASLSGISVSNANFDRFRFKNKDFSRCSLNACSFHGCVFEDCDFSSSTFLSCTLTGAVIRRSVFKGASFSDVMLTDTVVADSDFSGVSMTKVKLKASLIRTTTFVKASISQSYLKLDDAVDEHLVESLRSGKENSVSLVDGR